MKAFAVIISYPTYDPYYRGQRAFVVQARDEKAARAAALRQSPQGSRVIRIRLSQRDPA